MRLHRFYLKDIEKQGDLWITNDIGFIHQLKNVFRAKIGQNILVFNELIGEVELKLENISKKDMSFVFIRQSREVKISKGNKRQVCLYMSIIKNHNFELVLEKAVELGVDKIIPIITERTIKNNLNMDRLNKIIIEATEQSWRMGLLKIEKPVNLTDVEFNNANEKVFGSIEGKVNLFNHDSKNDIDIFVGPEGGFSDQEISLLTKNNVKAVCINENVLRAETAAIVFCAAYNL